MQELNKISEMFEEMYKKHENNHENIPWARKDVNPLLQTHLDEKSEHRGKALVIGCGLGDDAYALDKAGYDVVAIDISQTALDMAQSRFTDSNIVFEKQDIFDMSDKYFEYFDFVFESLTIQSLPRKFRKQMINAIADAVRKGGELLVVTYEYNGNNDGPPWPLTREEIDIFKTTALEEHTFDIVLEESQISQSKFKVLYKKP